MSENTQPPQHHQFLWPDQEAGPLRGRVWFDYLDDCPVIVGVELFGVDPSSCSAPWNFDLPDYLAQQPQTPDAPVRAADVRLPLGAILSEWVEQQRTFARASRELYVDEVPGHEQTVRRFEERLDGGKRVGRPRLSDEFLTRVAAIYRAARRDGDTAPALAVQRELHAAVPDTARGWIRQARKRGLLPPARRQGR